MRGEAPLASHLLYTQPGVLRDDVLEEREMGIKSGLAWTPFAECCVAFIDYGVTRGMAQGIETAEECDIVVEMRKIGKNK